MSVLFIRRPDGLGEPLGRYSHVAVASGELVMIAGQVGMDANGVVSPGGVKAQTRRVFENLGLALAAASVDYSNIVRTTTYLVGSSLLPAFMEGRGEVFADIFPDERYPPNTLVIVSGLVDDQLLVEVEAVAVKSTG